MKRFLPGVVAACLFSPVAIAQYDQMAERPQPASRKSAPAASENRCLAGASNIAGGWLEIPKNVVNVTNKSDFILYGLVGGLFKGVVDTVGRTGGGLVDLVACPFSVEPVIQPGYIWNDFQKDTRYGRVFYPKQEQ